MTDWTDLYAELDAWAAADRTVTLWWRDDDSQIDDHALADLLSLQKRLGVPLSMAVVPVAVDENSVRLATRSPLVSVLQHGYSHQNHAAPDQKKCELSDTRPPKAVLSELQLGWRRLRDLYGEHLLPVLVPPWNRIGDALIYRLPAQGYRGLSLMKSRNAVLAAPGLKQINTHVDIIDWHGSRAFVGTTDALGQLLAHLRGRRSGEFNDGEPTGLLTHHLVHDQGCRAFIEELISRTCEHPAARWLGARDIFL